MQKMRKRGCFGSSLDEGLRGTAREGVRFMPTCAEASELPDPTDEVVLMPPLPPGELGNAVFKFFEVGRGDFRVGQVPALNKVIAYSLLRVHGLRTTSPSRRTSRKRRPSAFSGAS